MVEGKWGGSDMMDIKASVNSATFLRERFSRHSAANSATARRAVASTLWLKWF